MEKPKHCPCCGNDAEVNFGRTHDYVIAYVICHNCGLRTGNHSGNSDREAAGKALEVWNRRTENE